MKGVESFSKILRDLLRGSRNWCPFTHPEEDLNPDCYSANPSVQSLLDWTRKWLMTPGLAFFYGGLVGRKNVLAGRRTVTAISEFS
jgi:hypothetical protein